MADEMSLTELIEAQDHWVLPLDGCAVIQCRVDFAFTIVAEGPEGTFDVRVEQPFEWFAGTDSQAPLLIDVEGDPTAAAPASTGEFEQARLSKMDGWSCASRTVSSCACRRVRTTSLGR